MLGRCREGNLERSKRLHTIKHNVFCMEVHFLLIELSSLFAHFIVPIKKLYAPLANTSKFRKLINRSEYFLEGGAFLHQHPVAFCLSHQTHLHV